MEFAWLMDFVELAKHGNFSRAAEFRNVTQPAFSRRIKLLEDWTGATLINRGSHPVELTEAGRLFLEQAVDIVERLNKARQSAQDAEESAKATLRFTATQVLSLSFFPKWLRTITSKFRVDGITLLSGGLEPCEYDMLQGKAQFLLCHYYEGMVFRLPPGEYTSMSIMVDRLMPVVAPDADGRPLYHLDRKQGETIPLLAYEKQTGLGRIFGTIFDIETMTPKLVPVASSHLALLLSLVLEGRGIAWVPESVVRTELAQKSLVESGGPQWSIPMEIRLFRPKERLSPAAETFWSFVSPIEPDET
ncbi:LysR family transcriptional regulator [Rhizobium binxianense]